MTRISHAEPWASNSTKSGNDTPLISVVTVVYNGEAHLETTILSVIKQLGCSFEYILVDGASTDNTLKIIERYKHKIDSWISEKDHGIYDAMNKGILKARGKWINFLNAGDVYHDNQVLKRVAGCLNDRYNLVYTDFIINGKRESPKLSLAYLTRNMLCHQAIFYKKDLFSEFLFNTDLKLAADYHHLLLTWNKIKSLSFSGSCIEYLGGGVSEQSSLKARLYHERCIAIKEANLKFPWRMIMYTYNRLRRLFC